jgi:thioredoxin reductase (NADPH)
MVTPEEIQSIALFTELGRAACEQVSRLAADVSLDAGEFAVNEGEERALFAVLAGHIQAVKTVDGVPEPVGDRYPGELFGEVPIVLGTVFPVGFRAAAASRVMRIEAGDYHAVAALTPNISVRLGELAQKRIGGLQDIAAKAPQPKAIVAGERWDEACTRLRHFLDRNEIRFKWARPDDPRAEELWGGPLPPAEDHPTLQVADGGKTVVRPGLRRVAELLELQTEADLAQYDTVVVGGGPAGLAAAVYGASEGLQTIVIERESPGGQAGTSSRIENYLGFPSGVSGEELALRALRQARRLGAEILVTRTLERIDPATRGIYLDGGDVLRAKTIIVACGVTWRRLEIEGFDRLHGKGITYGAARSDAASTHGLDVHIVGAGNSAGQAALHFANHARSVTILCRSGDLGKSMSHYLVDQIGRRSNIDVRTECSVCCAHGESSLESIDIRTSGDGLEERIPSGGLYIFIGADAETGWLPPEIALDARGYVLTGPDVRAAGRWGLERDPLLLETSVPGVFACGDVRSSPVKRVAAAVGEGSMAIAFVHQYLREPEAAKDPALAPSS